MSIVGTLSYPFVVKNVFNLFKKKVKKPLGIVEQINNILIGQTIKLKFRDPNMLGLTSYNSSLSLRYDDDDLDTRLVVGTLLLKKNLNGLTLIEVGCFKMRNGQRRERVYTFLAEEIETIDILD